VKTNLRHYFRVGVHFRSLFPKHSTISEALGAWLDDGNEESSGPFDQAHTGYQARHAEMPELPSFQLE
jgi:hypothetical protein